MLELWGPETRIGLGLLLWALIFVLFIWGRDKFHQKKKPTKFVDPNRIMEECKAERGLRNSLHRWQRRRGV